MSATFFLGLLGRFALVLSTARFREVLLGNAPRTALGETGTFVDAVFSFSAFFLALCFALYSRHFGLGPLLLRSCSTTMRGRFFLRSSFLSSSILSLFFK